MFVKSVADVCLLDLLLYLTKPSTNIDHSASVEKRFKCESIDYQMYYLPATWLIIFSYHRIHPFNWEPDQYLEICWDITQR